MDIDRLIRLSVAGWGFILSLLFHLWVFGIIRLPELKGIFYQCLDASDSKELISEGVASLVVGLLSAPILGLIVSVGAEFIVEWWRGGQVHAGLPRNDNNLEFDKYVEAIKRLVPVERASIEKIRAGWDPEKAIQTWLDNKKLRQWTKQLQACAKNEDRKRSHKAQVDFKIF